MVTWSLLKRTSRSGKVQNIILLSCSRWEIRATTLQPLCRTYLLCLRRRQSTDFKTPTFLLVVFSFLFLKNITVTSSLFVSATTSLHALVYILGGVPDGHLSICNAVCAADAWCHPARSHPGNHLLPQTQRYPPGRPTGTKTQTRTRFMCP